MCLSYILTPTQIPDSFCQFLQKFSSVYIRLVFALPVTHCRGMQILRHAVLDRWSC